MTHDPAAASRAWDAFVAGHAQAHSLQTTAWGSLKSQFGWWSRQVVVHDNNGDIAAGSLLLFRRVAGLTLAYAPKGPLTVWHDRALTTRLIAAMTAEARRQGAVVLKIEPDLPDTAQHRALLAGYGFVPSAQTVQPRSTVWLDLSGDDDAVLGRMKSKWRYNVRLAERKGVTVRAGGAADLAAFQELMETTGERDAFDVHSMAYYRRAFELFVPGQGVFLYAEYEGEPLAAIVMLHQGHTAWYLWGASSNRHRNRMPNHALQWAAMQWAKERGATRYDLWGIPDEIGAVAAALDGGRPYPAGDLPVDVNKLPEGGLWGVFRFKQGFGGVVERFVGAWDLPIQGVGFRLYQAGLALRQAGSLRQAAALLSARRQRPASPACRPVADAGQWRTLLAALPDAHVLQSWEWGEIKDQTGWQARRYALMSANGAPRAAFQILWRQPLPLLPLRVGYIPKGPVLDWADDETAAAVLAQVEALCRQQRGLFVKIDPDVLETAPAGRRLRALLAARGWRFSPEQIQFKNTAYTDLTPDEETLFATFKSKWRYNVRLAERRGITVRRGEEADLPAFFKLYSETGARDGFLIRPESYYRTVWQTLMRAGHTAGTGVDGVLLLAEHAEEEAPVAGLFLFRYGDRAWYFYGASSERRRRDMPNYLLQWRALQWAKAAGCTTYDWWGAPTDLADPDDGLQGVWRFKEGFGAEFRPHIGAWDWSPLPPLWRLYQQGMPLLLAWLRRGQA